MQAPTFQSEDDEARHYIAILRDGTDAEKVVARERLARIFERRGLFDEAVELYERNARAGVRTPELFSRLSEAYRARGDLERAEAALSEARRLQAAAAPQNGSAPASNRPAPAPNRPAPAPAPQGSAETAVRPAPTPPTRPTPPPEGRVIPFPTVPRAAPPPPPPAPAPAEAANTFKFDEAAPEDAPTETVARARRQPSSQTGPLAIVGIFLFMIVLPVAILAMLVVNPVMLYWEGKAAGPKIDVQDRTPARLKVTPGWASSLYLRDGRSVTGLWATTGLELVLDQEVPGAGQRFPVAPPTLQSWGETITVVERRGSGRSNQETTIPATFQAPSNLPSSGEALRGRIVGQVTAPRLTEGGQFTTATDTVEAPIELDIVSAPSLLLDRFLASLSLYLQEDRWLLVTIGALLCWCVLAGMTAIAMRMAAVLGGSD